MENTNPTSEGNGLRERVEKSLESIRPYLQADGGDIDLVDIEENGVVKVKLKGACGGCPSALVTLKQGVEARLKEDIPEVQCVEAV